MPGSVVSDARSAGRAGRARAWRRGASWRLWCPPGTAYPGDPVAPDLQDAVTVAALAREFHGSPAGTPETTSVAAPPARKPQLSGPLAESIAVSCVFGQVTAVREVSIQVRPGEIVGLLGANGAGKTTLIRMLLGLIPATDGQILLLGQQPSRQTRRRIGYVPQGLGLYDDLTVAENMAFAAAVFGSQAADPCVLPAGRSRSRRYPSASCRLACSAGLRSRRRWRTSLIC